MAPSQKRKAVDDDFVFTISDNEADIATEEVVEPAAPPKKKAKKDNKKSKKNKQATEDDEPVEEPAESIWGQKDEDDGAMDSEFEFVADDGANELEGDEFEGWGFDGAKKGMNTLENKGVDLDEIIRRRREKKEGKSDAAPAAEETNGNGEEEEDEEDLELDDDEDGVLAEDGFGMGVGSDVDEDEDEKNDDDEEEEEEEEYEDGDEPASDDDSVATPVNHPEDDGRSDSEEDEDPEEAAKREAFFAPEEKEKPGKKTNLSSFQGMSLSRPILRGLGNVGFTKPTPIQAKAIPIALMGKDVVGGAATGSGKTGAFIVPIIERLLYRPKKVATTRVIILLPTRELAIQCHAVATKLASFTDIKFCLAVGGLSLKVQEAELRLRPDVVIATPGRFIDHMRNSPSFTIETVEILVLDEADRMLEDGFADELNEILTTMPKSRQTMLFSATMTSSVDRLVRVGMNKPVRIMVDAQSKTVTTLVQEFVRLRPGREEKRMGYLVYLCKNLYTERVIIFFRQKRHAHRARIIFGLLGLSCAELHGSMNQTQRIESVENFRDGKVSFLLATDLASRGLDIKGVDTVINYEAPQSLDIYVHRVGRTARAGRTGTAVTLAAEPDRKVVKAAVRAGKSSGAKISSRVIDAAEADKLQEQIDEMEDEIEEIMEEEKQEKEIAHVEMQVKKGENMIRHEEEIKARPKRTWFETEKDKKEAKLAGKAELNGVREQLKKKGNGQLSNKDKKKLDAKAAMSEGRAWKKGRAERDGGGAIEAAKKAKKAQKVKRAAGPNKPRSKGKKR
ncbi:DEAD-domain-containing protein [Coniochaeta ligniaria NRRL 30616]|uniref:RNA helicase n=1 Tax=Coniochaeta ligniaria NRRL 30616 TaxID=1408157 RepID=A0A1J7J0W4_9PEZI|nr:DEAD-domain-containing protein [Coniochaeta ligniaria NRRL 30616]